MTSVSRKKATALIAEGKLDESWYLNTYPDVTSLGMSPAYHYRNYGALMGRAPNAEGDVEISYHDDYKDTPQNSELMSAAKKLTPPKPKHELKTAEKIAREQSYNLGIEFARLHVPKEHSFAIDTLRANQALSFGDEDIWLKYVNQFISHYGATPVDLQPGNRLLSRFTHSELPSVSGGPLVSVIMPAWNAEQSIAAAANSILRQTWKNLELLIVDDASQDGTWGEIQRLAASDSRVKIYRNAINVGPYVAKNIALSMAQGEWITGHDADDWAHPQRLERHLKEVLSMAKPPRASVGYMLRLLPEGYIDRFTSLSYFSADGVSRDAPISCMFNAKFLREELGSWDCVRFGADSELMGRVTATIGDEFRRIPFISMLCISEEGSLTNHPTLGVSRETGPSKVRREYAEAWRKWHKNLRGNAHMEFPPKLKKKRQFKASKQASVPTHNVWRNYASITGLDPQCDEAVTAICSSKRPEFLEHISHQMRQQTHKNLHLIYVAHGPGHNLALVEKSFRGLASIKVLSLPDENARLGDALNLALKECKTDLVAKIDDDDFYGPNYIRSSVAALKYNGNKKVGIVGRGSAYCYIEERDALVLRFQESLKNKIYVRAFGGTIFWSRKTLGDLRYQSLPRAVDTAFFKDARARGARIYSGEPYDYVHVRYAKSGEHTWQIDTDAFMRPTTPVSNGLSLGLAYSTKADSHLANLPTHNASKRALSPETEASTTSSPPAAHNIISKPKIKPLVELANRPDLVDLAFRSAFLGTKNNEIPQFAKDWGRISVAGFQFSYSKDCKIIEISKHGKSAVVFGECFVCHGEKQLEEILYQLIETGDTSLLDALSGRFCIAFEDQSGQWLVNDPAGSRTIYCTSSGDAVASHATILAQAIGARDDDKILQLISDEAYRRRGTVYLPGNATRFEGVSVLTPNMKLDLSNGKMIRYWPLRATKAVKFSELMASVEEYFYNYSRYLKSLSVPIVIGLTGGYDCRAMVAALKHFDVPLNLMTWTGGRLGPNERDVVDHLIAYLGDSHVFIDPRTSPQNEEDREILEASHLAGGGHRGVSRLTLSMSKHFPKDSCFVRGFGGEVMRGFYNKKSDLRIGRMAEAEVTKILADKYITKKNDTCSSNFRESAHDFTASFVRDTNFMSIGNFVDALDIYYWEQRVGTWASNMLNEDDPATYAMCGFNSRKIYGLALGLPRRERIGGQMMLKIAQKYDPKFAKLGVVS